VVAAAEGQDVNLVIFSGGSTRSPLGINDQLTVLYDLDDPARIDGLVLATGSPQDYEDLDVFGDFKQAFPNIPITSIAVSIPGVPRVIVDNTFGMAAVVEHVIKTHDAPADNRQALLLFPGKVGH
jgi:DNA-binding LacI/PurR family transcriptional regulator